jgi:hypothetical protein
VLIAAAFVPSTPMLVPELAAGAAHELDDAREACDAAVDHLLDAEPDLIVVLGSAPRSGPYPATAAGTFAPWGVDLRVGPADSAAELPLSLVVGRWLLDRQEVSTPVLPFGVAPDEDPQRCEALGSGLATRSPRIAALVVGDGTACRDPKAPGSFDPRAADVDAAIDDALADPASEGLRALDVELARDLKVDGRAAWQVAQAMESASLAYDDDEARDTDAGEGSRGPRGRLEGRLLRCEEPFGVHYVIATWGLSTS